MPSFVRTDGLLDRYLNRKCSRYLTRIFLRTSISPNSITLIALSTGLLSAAIFLHGTYTAGILAALLFQLSSILDCCDGEVARIKNLESSFGDFFDVFADNTVHVAIVVSIAWVAYLAQGSLYLLLGLIAVIGILIDFLVMFRSSQPEIIDRLGNCRISAPKSNSRIDYLLAGLANRDFSIIVFILAVAGKLEWFIWLAAFGSHTYWILYLWQSSRLTSR